MARLQILDLARSVLKEKHIAQITTEFFYNFCTRGLYYKSFMIAIYNRNDSMILEPGL